MTEQQSIVIANLQAQGYVLVPLGPGSPMGGPITLEKRDVRNNLVDSVSVAPDGIVTRR